MANERPAKRGAATSSVHGGELRQQEANAITTPIYQTSTFWFKNSREVMDYQEGKTDPRGVRSLRQPHLACRRAQALRARRRRGDGPLRLGDVRRHHDLLRDAARGSHLIVTSDCYRRTRQFIEEFLGRMGVETTVIEPSDLESFEKAIRDDTALFFTESPTNPYLRVTDVPRPSPRSPTSAA